MGSGTILRANFRNGGGEFGPPVMTRVLSHKIGLRSHDRDGTLCGK